MSEWLGAVWHVIVVITTAPVPLSWWTLGWMVGGLGAQIFFFCVNMIGFRHQKKQWEKLLEASRGLKKQVDGHIELHAKIAIYEKILADHGIHVKIEPMGEGAPDGVTRH